MREPEEMGWYEVEGQDGQPRACHAIKRLVPEGIKEISEARAKQISADVRARETQPSAAIANAAAAGIDLKPLQDQINRVSQVVTGHAAALDQQQTRIDAVSQSVTTFMEGQKNLGGGEG